MHAWVGVDIFFAQLFLTAAMTCYLSGWEEKVTLPHVSIDKWVFGDRVNTDEMFYQQFQISNAFFCVLRCGWRALLDEAQIF